MKLTEKRQRAELIAIPVTDEDLPTLVMDGVELHTVLDWSSIYWSAGLYRVRDPDGFDRQDQRFASRLYTREQFEFGAAGSTCEFGPRYRPGYQRAVATMNESSGRLGSTPESPPVRNQRTPVWDLVIGDMRGRDEWGTGKYGTRLQPFNGRRALVDAYEEGLDLVVYMRMKIHELGELKARLNSIADQLSSTNLDEDFEPMAIELREIAKEL